MTYLTLSGKVLSDSILEVAKEEVSSMKRKPGLAVVLVGDNPASVTYVDKKKKSAESVGMKFELVNLPKETSESELLSVVERLNNDPAIDGFIVQLPLPKQIDEKKVLLAIDSAKDVDGFHPVNMGRMLAGDESVLLPATPAGIIKMIEHFKIPVAGKHAVIVGRSNIVGKPIASLLLNRDATVTVCHSKTKDLAVYTRTADVLVVAVGKPKMITADMVKEGAYVIDVGTTKVEGKLTGDVDFESVIKKAHCSPVPGGVGLLTVSALISNTVKAAKSRG
jgi:methylenetetrahydrofolate dehydrogenase (NADP+)/methenyltetrahydrofolate cyclohydrolase